MHALLDCEVFAIDGITAIVVPASTPCPAGQRCAHRCSGEVDVGEWMVGATFAHASTCSRCDGSGDYRDLTCPSCAGLGAVRVGSITGLAAWPVVVATIEGEDWPPGVIVRRIDAERCYLITASGEGQIAEDVHCMLPIDARPGQYVIAVAVTPLDPCPVAVRHGNGPIREVQSWDT